MSRDHHTPSADPALADIERQIAETREQLGRTVEELAAKADVPARAKAKASQTAARVRLKAQRAEDLARARAAEAGERMKHGAARADGRVHAHGHRPGRGHGRGPGRAWRRGQGGGPDAATLPDAVTAGPGITVTGPGGAPLPDGHDRPGPVVVKPPEPGTAAGPGSGDGSGGHHLPEAAAVRLSRVSEDQARWAYGAAAVTLAAAAVWVARR